MMTLATSSMGPTLQVSVWVWALFASLVLAMLALDLGIFRTARRGPTAVTFRSAAVWRAAWIGLGLGFGLIVLVMYGSGPALADLTASRLDKALPVEHVSVFALIFPH